MISMTFQKCLRTTEKVYKALKQLIKVILKRLIIMMNKKIKKIKRIRIQKMNGRMLISKILMKKKNWKNRRKRK